MKIALISDIHANLPALEAVMAEASQADMIVCCGDVVGYYAQPNQTCELLRELEIPTVRGNHDAYVCGFLEPASSNVEAYKVEWTRSKLTESNLSWLSKLPTEIQFTLEGFKLRIRHASPWDEETYLYPDSDRLEEIQLEQHEIVAVGHTHWPLVRQAGLGLLVNAGSVGQPRDYIPKPSFAILNLPDMTVEIRRSDYAVATYQQYLAELQWDSKVIDILSREKRSQDQ